jgi:hypothetical protein
MCKFLVNFIFSKKVVTEALDSSNTIETTGCETFKKKSKLIRLKPSIQD